MANLDVRRAETRDPSRTLALADTVATRLVARALPVRFRPAASASEVEAAHRLRYATVVEQGWAAPGTLPDGTERDEDDDRAVHVVGWDGDVLAATARLVLPSADRPLPVERDFALTLEPRGAVVDVGRGIVARPYRGPDHRVFLGLLAHCWLEVRARGFRHFCGAVNDAVLARYRAFGLPLTVLGSGRPNWGEERYPVLVDALECAEAMLRARRAGRIDRWGGWSDEFVHVARAEEIATYAAATADPDPRHGRAELAPPLYAVIPARQAVEAALLPVLSVSRVPPSFPRLLGEYDATYHRSIGPGSTVRTRAALVGADDRTAGTAYSVRAETRDEVGVLLNEQHAIAFVPGFHLGRTSGSQPPERPGPRDARAGPPLETAARTIEPDQLRRYAAVSGDPNPIHLDDAFARSVGLPGVVAHGPCVLAMVCQELAALVAGGDQGRLRRLVARFARPVRPGQRIATRVWLAAGPEHGPLRCVFETVVEDGTIVLKDGFAEYAPS